MAEQWRALRIARVEQALPAGQEQRQQGLQHVCRRPALLRQPVPPSQVSPLLMSELPVAPELVQQAEPQLQPRRAPQTYLMLMTQRLPLLALQL